MIQSGIAVVAETWRRVSVALFDLLASEKDRWRLWLPVGLGIGIATYFGLMSEPSPWIAASSAILASLVVILGRRWPALLAAALTVPLLAGGVGIAQWNTHDVAAPKLAKQLYTRKVEGRVAAVSAMPRGLRLLLENLTITGVDPSQSPKYVRVTTRQPDGVVVGDRVRLRASLRPPSWPALPGSFDFERKAFFEQIGAYGFTLGRVEVIASSGAGPLSDLSIRLNRSRQVIGRRILAGSSPGSGAIAQALMTGDRGSIAAADLDVMRDSGLAHLLAISGLHVGLMAATLFFVLRAMLALVPALAVLVISPQSILGPSFQLSFAAVIALIAVYEALRGHFRR